MTLCIAWKTKDTIHIASDSRLSRGDKYVDIGIKVLAIPVKITLPAEKGAQETVVYNHSIGMCFAGATVTGLLVKESMAEVLQNLQGVPGYSDFSFAACASQAYDVYQGTIDSISSSFGPAAADFDCLLAGYCPKNKKLEAYLLSCLVSNGTAVTSMTEVLVSQDYLFMGSGKSRAQQLYAAGRRDYLHMVRHIADEVTEPSVGGSIQYGKFVDTDFAIFGIVEYERVPDELPKVKYTLRGTNMHSDGMGLKDGKFFIKYTYVTPFEAEFHRLVKEYQDSLK